MEFQSLDHFRIDADHWPTLLVRVNVDTLGKYSQFRASLKANYAIVWRDIALGYAALFATLCLVSLAPGIVGGLAAAIVGAIAIGFIIAYLQLFIHEAAHWNLAKSRKASDRIGNIAIAWHVGTSVAAYRKVHFDHHRYLGHEGDGERSYIHRLNWRLIIEMVTGIHALRIFLARSRAPKDSAAKSEAAPTSRLPLVRGIAVHGLLLAGLLAMGAWSAALAWIGGMAIFYPLFGTLRPLLEHRPSSSDSALLAGKREAVTRIFEDGLFARTFGGAGFSRHLLHHWEPQVSYTRLEDLERYLSATSIGAIIDARRTTYVQAFRDILASDNGR